MVPIVIGVIVMLVVGGGIYYYTTSKKDPGCPEDQIKGEDGTCVPKVPGCRDNTKLNFNKAANFDDPTMCGATIVRGCMDETKLGYVEDANVDDGSCGDTIVRGCTEPTKIGYVEGANVDDGTCGETIVRGCTEPTKLGYVEGANVDDGTCGATIVRGCTEPTKLGYVEGANVDDGTCGATKVSGCTNSDAKNYNSAANADDGSCIAKEFGCNTDPDATNYNPDANMDEECEYDAAEIQFANLSCPRWVSDPMSVQNGQSLCESGTNTYADEIEKASGYKMYKPEEGKMFLCPGTTKIARSSGTGYYYRGPVHNSWWQYDHQLVDCDISGENCTARPCSKAQCQGEEDPNADQCAEPCGVDANGNITTCQLRGGEYSCRKATADFSVGYNLNAMLSYKPEGSDITSARLVDDAIAFCDNDVNCTGFVWKDAETGAGQQFLIQTCKSGEFGMDDYFIRELNSTDTKLPESGGFPNDPANSGIRQDSIYFQKSQ